MKRDVLRLLRACAVAACGCGVLTGCASTQFTDEPFTCKDQVNVELPMSVSMPLSPILNFGSQDVSRSPANLACPTP